MSIMQTGKNLEKHWETLQGQLHQRDPSDGGSSLNTKHKNEKGDFYSKNAQSETEHIESSKHPSHTEGKHVCKSDNNKTPEKSQKMYSGQKHKTPFFKCQEHVNSKQAIKNFLHNQHYPARDLQSLITLTQHVRWQDLGKHPRRNFFKNIHELMKNLVNKKASTEDWLWLGCQHWWWSEHLGIPFATQLHPCCCKEHLKKWQVKRVNAGGFSDGTWSKQVVKYDQKGSNLNQVL